jgi:DNA-binding IscR family transcriptional regulator
MVVDCAGHMGPLTHALEVSRLIVEHIAAVRLNESFAPMEATQQALRAFLEALDGYTIADLLTPSRRLARLLALPQT